MSFIRDLTTEGKFVFGIASFILLVIVFSICFKVYSVSQKETIEATIIDLQQQQKISGSNKNVSTDIRYLVITDKETFCIKNSILNWKFNNSDIFYRLENGKKYSFRVSGVGKGIITDYRNILSVQSNNSK